MRSSLTRRSRYSQKVLVNSGWESSRSMMRKSGVRPAVCWSKLTRDMPRRAASGQSPSMQAGKLAAAARIASRVISGWPEAPGCPLHSGAGAGAGTAPVDRSGANSDRRSGICAAAGVNDATRSAKQISLIGLEPIGISLVSLVRGPDSTPAVPATIGPRYGFRYLNNPPSSTHPRTRNSMKPIRKAVFPVAGLGTRFLPATKAMPKEMLPVVDRPVIQLVVIEDHFDKQFELESTLQKRGKSKELDLLEAELPGAGQTSFTRQQEPLGLGHAVWCAREIVGNEPFALMLPDMLHFGARGCLAEMMDVYRDGGGNVMAVYEVPREQVDQYGIVSVG